MTKHIVLVAKQDALIRRKQFGHLLSLRHLAFTSPAQYPNCCFSRLISAAQDYKSVLTVYIGSKVIELHQCDVCRDAEDRLRRVRHDTKHC